MTDTSANKQAERQKIVSALVSNIMETAQPLIDTDTKPEEIQATTDQIEQRLNFEANVAFSEVVTKYARRRRAETPTVVSERTFMRFGRNFRAQHMLMIVSVILLIITGMPLKFPDSGISRFVVIDVFGGVQNSTLVHRIAAVGLIIVGAWHLGYILFSGVGRRDFWLMIPRPTDAKNAFHMIMYYIGRRASIPKFGRFSFIEKFDYWAVYWGMVIMIGSGLILWFKEGFSKGLFDIAREAHSDEGLLATLAIIIWHFYNVHLNPDVFPMSWVWIRGTLTESEMKHHHPLEYAEIVDSEAKKFQEDSGDESRKDSS
jgi:formate dehydrogenase subunit gamma